MSADTLAFDPAKARFNMIEQQIRPWEVLDARVLGLLAEVKREDFVPEAYRSLAFVDMDTPLQGSAGHGQCMLAPKVEARLLQDLGLKADGTVLEIGTGSGHMAALMSKLCQRVVSLELDPALALSARGNLHKAGIHNVEVLEADAVANGYTACRKAAPYDHIVLSGSVAEVPQALLDMLKVGGRLAAVVGQDPIMRMTFIDRVAANSFHRTEPWDTVAPRLRHFPEPSRFQF